MARWFILLWQIGCTARTVKLVSRKQIFLILPDQDASAGLEGGK